MPLYGETVKANAYVTQSHHFDHLGPVFDALSPAFRGDLYVGHDVATFAYVTALGFDPLVGMPPPSDIPVIVASGNELPAVQRAILLAHGIEQRYTGIDHVCWAGGPGRDHVILFVVPDEAAARANWDRYPNTPCAIVGSPHVEVLRTLPPYPLAEQRIAITGHWEANSLAPEMRGGFAWFESAYEKLCRARPESYVLHGHPKCQDYFAWKAREWQVEFEPSFEQLTQRAWCLIGDNTSAIYEWAALNRPVVVVSPPWYRRDVEHSKRFWEMCDVGPHVSDPAVLEAAIDVSMADPAPIAMRRQHICLELFGADLSAGASARAARAIEEVLSE